MDVHDRVPVRLQNSSGCAKAGVGVLVHEYARASVSVYVQNSSGCAKAAAVQICPTGAQNEVIGHCHRHSFLLILILIKMLQS